MMRKPQKADGDRKTVIWKVTGLFGELAGYKQMWLSFIIVAETVAQMLVLSASTVFLSMFGGDRSDRVDTVLKSKSLALVCGGLMPCETPAGSLTR